MGLAGTPSSTGAPFPPPPHAGRVHATDKLRPYKQDLPPKGGYAPINFKRIPAKQLVNAPILFGGYLASMAFGYYHVSQE